MDWQEQFKSMKRWYYRIRQNFPQDQDVFSKHDSNNKDYFTAFFVTCYHFKDALIENTSIPRGEVEDYIDKNSELQLAGDIANLSKHTKLTSTRTGDLTTKSVSTVMVYGLENGPTYSVERMYIQSNGNFFDAFEIAEKCLRLWHKFLISNSMLVPNIIEEDILENFRKVEF